MSEYLKSQKIASLIEENGSNRPRIYFNKIWSIGGDTGWYYGDWLWDLRGFIDKYLALWLPGTPIKKDIHAGDVLDFGAYYMLIKKKEISFVC
jgi:hypothetical protein